MGNIWSWCVSPWWGQPVRVYENELVILPVPTLHSLKLVYLIFLRCNVCKGEVSFKLYGSLVRWSPRTRYTLYLSHLPSPRASLPSQGSQSCVCSSTTCRVLAYAAISQTHLALPLLQCLACLMQPASLRYLSSCSFLTPASWYLFDRQDRSIEFFPRQSSYLLAKEALSETLVAEGMSTDCNTAANDVVDADWTVDVFNVLKGVDHSCNKRLMSTSKRCPYLDEWRSTLASFPQLPSNAEFLHSLSEVWFGWSGSSLILFFTMMW